MIKQNLHTHSLYCDGNDSLEEMILEAINKGFTTLGFSGHGYLTIDDCCMSLDGTGKYKKEVNSLKNKYKDQIDIFLGVEEDYSLRVSDPQSYDFIIGSRHYIINQNQEVRAIDYYKELYEKIVNEWYKGDIYRFIEEYYKDEAKMAEWKEVDIIGHVDLLSKYNEDEYFFRFDDPFYLKCAYDCLDTLVKADKIIEVNTGAMARKNRSFPYPYRNLLSYIASINGRICLNSDCHNRHNLDYAYDQAIKWIEEAGFKNMEVLTKDGFVSRDLKDFK